MTAAGTPAGRGDHAWRSVPAEIAARTAAAPDTIAVSHGTQVCTYRELAGAAAGISELLGDAGVCPGQRVAVTGAPGVALTAAWIAVLTRRAVLVPVDPLLPAPRRRPLLGHADHLLTAGDPPGDAVPMPVIELGRHLAAYRGPLRWLQTPDPAPDEPGYLFFTSGTTGRAKGIVGRHRSLAHFLHWQRTTFGLGGGDRVAHLASVEFDPSLREVFLPLTSGATLCLPDTAPLPAGQALAWLADEQVSVVHAVPTVARAWLRAAPPGARLPRLRLLLFNGEPLPEAVVRRWREHLGYRGEIINLYGPTETTLARCWHRVADPAPPGIQPLGRPIPDTTISVQGPTGPAEPDQTGEIIIRTPYGTGGYLDATAAERGNFLTDDADPDATVFRTGDLGHLDHDGVLHFDGRTDDQIKIYGVRVSVTAVEAVLEQQPSVEQAAVTIAAASAETAPRLIAHLILADGHHDLPATLRAELREQLPAAAIPAQFLIVTSLPTTTASGKTDRRALAAHHASS